MLPPPYGKLAAPIHKALRKTLVPMDRDNPSGRARGRRADCDRRAPCIGRSLGIFKFRCKISRGASDGDALPMANDNHGYGSVGIRFYPPLAPYILALIAFVTGSWYHAIWIYLVAWMIVGCAGVYLFAKEIGTPTQAVLAGMLYAIVPFPLAEIYRFPCTRSSQQCARLSRFLFPRQGYVANGNGSTSLSWSFVWSSSTHTYSDSDHHGDQPRPLLTRTSHYRTSVRRNDFYPARGRGGAGSCSSSFHWIKLVTEHSWVAHHREEYSTGVYAASQWLFPNSFPVRDVPSYYFPLFRNIDAMIVLTAALLVPALGHFADPTRLNKQYLRPRYAGLAFVGFGRVLSS